MSRLRLLLNAIAGQLDDLTNQMCLEASKALEQRNFALLESLSADLRIADEVLRLIRPLGQGVSAPAESQADELLAIHQDAPSLEESPQAEDFPAAVLEPEPSEPEPAPLMAEEAQTNQAEPAQVEAQPTEPSRTETDKKPEAEGPARRTAPRPEAQPKPKHLVAPQGKELEAIRHRFFEDSRTLQESETTDKTNRCLIKSTICLGWFLYHVEGDKPVKESIQEEVLRLVSFWKTHGDGYLICNDKKLITSPEAWHAFSRSFRFMHYAWIAVGMLSENGIKDKRALLERIAYCETSLFRLIYDYGLNVFDKDQHDLHRYLENSGYAPFPCWKAHVEGGPKTETVFEHAATLEREIVEAENQRVKKEARNKLLADLVHHIDKPKSLASFDEGLRELVVRCLDGGIPPSNTELRRILAPYQAELSAINHSQAPKLLDYLKKDADKTLAKKLQIVEVDVPEDPEHEQRLAEVKKLLKDKSMLIVGGNKGQAKRVEEMKKKLGLKSLEWPSTEEHTKNTSLEDDVKRADFVCLAVRWARHSRKDLIEYAKQQGKKTAILPHGTGFNKVVYDLYGQWCNGNGHMNSSDQE